MQLDSTFSVFAPIDRVWRVAGRLPGAEVLAKLSDDAYTRWHEGEAGPSDPAVQRPVERD
jgi:hypothetical protein